MVQAVIPAMSTNRATHFELHWYQMEYISFVKSRGCLIKQAVQRVQRFLRHGKSTNDVDQQPAVKKQPKSDDPEVTQGHQK